MVFTVATPVPWVKDQNLHDIHSHDPVLSLPYEGQPVQSCSSNTSSPKEVICSDRRPKNQALKG